MASATLADEPDAVGREMRRALGLDGGWAVEVHTWQVAVSELRRAIEDLGVMAVINGVVGNNTYRRLSVEEFRGFALTDPHAPLIFVNGCGREVGADVHARSRVGAHMARLCGGLGLSGATPRRYGRGGLVQPSGGGVPRAGTGGQSALGGSQAAGEALRGARPDVQGEPRGRRPPSSRPESR